jgi:hypothetical protein
VWSGHTDELVALNRTTTTTTQPTLHAVKKEGAEAMAVGERLIDSLTAECS